MSLSDTVGFIRDLPHGLVEAFQATLQEATEADLLLHVVDASNPDFAEQMEQVRRVLEDIGAERLPQVLVFNKVDAIDVQHQPVRARDVYEVDGTPVPRVFVSARTGQGLDLLRSELAQIVREAMPEPAQPEADVRDIFRALHLFSVGCLLNAGAMVLLLWLAQVVPSLLKG